MPCCSKRKSSVHVDYILAQTHRVVGSSSFPPSSLSVCFAFSIEPALFYLHCKTPFTFFITKLASFIIHSFLTLIPSNYTLCTPTTDDITHPPPTYAQAQTASYCLPFQSWLPPLYPLARTRATRRKATTNRKVATRLPPSLHQHQRPLQLHLSSTSGRLARRR